MSAAQGGLLTLEQARAQLNVGETFIRAEVARGNLRAHRLGTKLLRFDAEDLRAYIEASRTDAPRPTPTARRRKAVAR